MYIYVYISIYICKSNNYYKNILIQISLKYINFMINMYILK